MTHDTKAATTPAMNSGTQSDGPDARCQTGQEHNAHRLTRRGAVRLDFLVNRYVEFRSADHSSGKARQCSVPLRAVALRCASRRRPIDPACPECPEPAGMEPLYTDAPGHVLPRRLRRRHFRPDTHVELLEVRIDGRGVETSPVAALVALPHVVWHPDAKPPSGRYRTVVSDRTWLSSSPVSTSVWTRRPSAGSIHILPRANTSPPRRSPISVGVTCSRY